MTTAPQDEESYRLEGIAFGLADGLIMCLGLIIGVAEATLNAQLVLITGIIGGFANAFGNSIGFYMGAVGRAGTATACIDRPRCSHTCPSETGSAHQQPLLLRLHHRRRARAAPAVHVSLLKPCHCAHLRHWPAIAFVLGSYVGKIGRDNPYTTGLKYVILAVLGAVISHFIADLIQLVA